VTKALPVMLVVEDGSEYEEFARTFLGSRFAILTAHSAREAIERLRGASVDVLLVDLRFERAPSEVLIGDVEATAKRLFGGDRVRALRWIKDQQGTLVLAEIRKAGFAQRAVFVHDFPQERLKNLGKLYGDVHAVPGFDAAAIGSLLDARPRGAT
jgi:ActR/RegA family two-component response regulator